MAVRLVPGPQELPHSVRRRGPPSAGPGNSQPPGPHPQRAECDPGTSGQASGTGSAPRHSGIQRRRQFLGQGHPQDLGNHPVRRGGCPLSGHRRADRRGASVHPRCPGTAMETDRVAGKGTGIRRLNRHSIAGGDRPPTRKWSQVVSKKQKRQLVLNVFFQRFGHHIAAWRHPSSTGNGRPDLNWWLNAAKLAEAAKFHTFFVADFIGRSGDITPETGRSAISYQFEPFTLLSAVAAVTKHIGLVATVNTNYEHPYHVARRFTSLDHISGGRAGWNIVSSLSEHTAKNFGIDKPLSHEERYERAAEFVELAKA